MDNTVTLDCDALPKTKEGKTPQRPKEKSYTDAGVGFEDCAWTYVWDKGPAKGKTYARSGPRERAPSAYPGSHLLSGPRCFGNRYPIPAGEGTPAGTPAAPADPGFANKGCDYRQRDEPSITVPANCNFTWHWASKAEVLSTCPAGGDTPSGNVDVYMEGTTKGVFRTTKWDPEYGKSKDKSEDKSKDKDRDRGDADGTGPPK